MVQQDKLVQFYFTQYRDSALKLKKKKNDGKSVYEKRIRSLFQELKRTGSAKIKKAKLEDYHRQIRNVSYYAFREKNQIAMMEIRDMLLPELVRPPPSSAHILPAQEDAAVPDRYRSATFSNVPAPDRSSRSWWVPHAG